MKILLWIVALVVFLLGLVKYIEKNSIFFPMKKITATPESAGLAHEEIFFTTSDGIRLHSWFIPKDDAGFTVLFCHGNAGNIGHRLEKLSMLYELGLSIFIFDYRGYGRSSGAPSEAGLYKDAAAAYKYLTEERRIPAKGIILYGESIGAAAAIDLARRVEVAGLITEEAFASAKDMAKTAYPFIPHILFSSKFNSASKIKSIACPKLIIHSLDDEIVPFWQAQRLFENAMPPKTFLEIRGAHNTAFMESKEQFIGGIESFLAGQCTDKILDTTGL